MNQEERDWLEWLKRVQDGVVTQQQAAAKMGVSDPGSGAGHVRAEGLEHPLAGCLRLPDVIEEYDRAVGQETRRMPEEKFPAPDWTPGPWISKLQVKPKG
jgi:hypothetical protein